MLRPKARQSWPGRRISANSPDCTEGGGKPMGRRDRTDTRSRPQPSRKPPVDEEEQLRLARASKAAGAPAAPRVIELPETMIVRDLARALRVNPIDVIKELMSNGIVAGINQTIDYETAAIVAGEMGFQTQPIRVEEPEADQKAERVGRTLWQTLLQEESPESVKPRPPVVTVL
ncbi:MAG: hypothetical protein EHM56_02510, partial [Chloroflexi bacterium]